jgi:hypothetical protein
MPTVTVYRSRRSIGRPDGRWSVGWTEYGFSPTPGGEWTSDAGWAHARSDPEPIRVRVPPGELKPADAAAAYYLAERGEDGFRLEGTEVAKKRDDGPMLFHDDAPDPRASAYPRAVAPPERPRPAADPAADPARLRARVAELAAEVIRPVVDSIGRALAQLEAALEADDLARVVTARAILQTALEDAGRPAAGGTEAA